MHNNNNSELHKSLKARPTLLSAPEKIVYALTVALR